MVHRLMQSFVFTVMWQQPQSGLPYEITLRNRWRGFRG